MGPESHIADPQSQRMPLCVDLDGTLVRCDLLAESLVAAFRRAPWVLLWMPFWLLSGRQRLKAELARIAGIDAAVLPYNDDVLALVKAAAERGRRVVLVTGSHRMLAEAVQAELGVFDEILATDATVNLTGGRKAAALTRRFGAGGYEYVGNGRVDLPIWRECGSATVVGAPAGLVRRVSGLGKPHHVIPRSARRLEPWLRALRIHQWAKNALLFLPVLTSHRVSDPQALSAVLLAFVCFGLCASSTYVFNDLMDLDADRRHRTKRLRPFAAGTLPVSGGILMSAILLTAGLAGSLLLPLGFRVTLLLYLTTTVLYSLWLKRTVALDIVILASLYTLRVIAGGFAAGIALSFWLLAFSMFLFLSLAMAKRVAELGELESRAAAEGTPLRKARGRQYKPGDLPVLRSMGASSGYLAVLVLALYINSPDTRSLYRSPEVLWLIVPLLLLWVTRLWIITGRGGMDEDPVVFAVKDPETWATAAAIGLVMAAAATLAW